MNGPICNTYTLCIDASIVQNKNYCPNRRKFNTTLMIHEAKLYKKIENQPVIL